MKLFKNQKTSSRGVDELFGYLRERPKLARAVLQVFFVLLSLALYWTVFRLGRGLWSVDNLFHWERLKELSADIQHGTFPQFDHYTAYSGIGTTTFYPWLTWLPLAVLVLMHVPPVFILGFYPIAITYLGLNIAYYSFFSYDRSHIKALIFSVLYWGSFVMTALQFMQAEDAEFLAYTFAPLALFGWLKIMHGSKRYRMLVIGLALMLFTHLLAPLIMAVGLGLLTILSANRLNKAKIKTFAVSAVAFLVTTCAVWLPILVLLKTNVIAKPEVEGSMGKFAVLLPLNSGAVGKAFETLWGIPEMVAVIIGAWKFRKLSYYGKRIFILGVLLLLFNAQFMPWGLIEKTPIAQIQFPTRVVFLMRMCLMYVLAEVTCRGWKHADKIARLAGIATLIFLSMFVSFKGEQFQKKQSLPPRAPHFRQTNVYGLPKGYSYKMAHHQHVNVMKVGINLDAYVLTNRDMNNQDLLSTSYNTDYAPKSAVRHKYQKMKAHGSPIADVKSYNGKTTFTAKRNLKNVQPPFMLYNAQRYKFFLDGHPVSYTRTNYHKPVLHNVKQGRHTVTFQTPVMWYRVVAMLVSLEGFVWLGATFMDDDLCKLMKSLHE